MIPETFADGIGRIGFSEGMVRIELVSVALQDKDNKVVREACHRLVMTPQGFMQAVQAQLNLVRKLEEAGVIRRSGAPGEGAAPGATAANGGPRSPNFQGD
jgi:hypothetical protein